MTTPEQNVAAERVVDVYRDKAGEFRWKRKVRANGKIVADSGEGYDDADVAWAAAERENPGVEVRRARSAFPDDPDVDDDDVA